MRIEVFELLDHGRGLVQLRDVAGAQDVGAEDFRTVPQQRVGGTRAWKWPGSPSPVPAEARGWRGVEAAAALGFLGTLLPDIPAKEDRDLNRYQEIEAVIYVCNVHSCHRPR